MPRRRPSCAARSRRSCQGSSSTPRWPPRIRKNSGGSGRSSRTLARTWPRAEDARAVAAHYVAVMDAVRARGLNAQVAVKPTHLGLDIDAALAREQLHQLMTHAEATNNFIWLDMESSPYVDRTLDLFRELRQRSPRDREWRCRRISVPHGTATWSQLRAARMRRSALVKGGVSLSRQSVAFPEKARRRTRASITLSCRLLGRRGGGARARLLHMATHDRGARRSAGTGPSPTRADAAAGLRVRDAVRDRGTGAAAPHPRAGVPPARADRAYGEAWFPWYMRRLAERPANLAFVVKNLVAR